MGSDPTVLTIPPDSIEWQDDADGEDGRGLASVEILGARHHLMFIPVRMVREFTNGEAHDIQRGSTEYAEDDMVRLQALYEASAYQTVTIEGRPGEYVVYMHPAEV